MHFNHLYVTEKGKETDSWSLSALHVCERESVHTVLPENRLRGWLEKEGDSVQRLQFLLKV